MRLLPLEYKKCYIYGLKSKKILLDLLHIDRKIYCKKAFINSKITPMIKIKNDKKRLVEAPDKDIIIIQSNILKALQELEFPSYVFSGIKGKSYIDNAQVHANKKYLFKIDISKFFPNISRDKVYKFYLKKLQTSPDVANILTNLSTVDLDFKNQQDIRMIDVNEFIKETSINERNHLITGSPISSIMSYLANVDMFEDIYLLATKYNISMTVYVDDVVFTSNNRIPSFFRKNVLDIIRKNGYRVSEEKCEYYNTPTVKKVTGVILDKNGNMQVPNKLMFKTHNYINEVKKGDLTNIDKLQGCLVATKSINGKLKEFQGQLKKIKENKE
ncbi:MAG: reverse transcriptase family protein [Clostridia bacterium]|nr:reverse transcriptase family protein [Clostridia bacterium]